MLVGVLSFHGNVAEHKAVLDDLHVAHREVKTHQDLDGVTHLILPGGESTVIGKFLETSGLGEVIIERTKNGSLAVLGTCAGAILLAKHVTGKNAPKSLALLDITIDRNAYGTQAQSFRTELTLNNKTFIAAFIRAPVITAVGSTVDVLSLHEHCPVVVRSGRMLAATCHPELVPDSALHELFLTL